MDLLPLKCSHQARHGVTQALEELNFDEVKAIIYLPAFNYSIHF
jgi:hypothetical protein